MYPLIQCIVDLLQICKRHDCGGKLIVLLCEMCGIGLNVSSDYFKSPDITWPHGSFRLSSNLVV